MVELEHISLAFSIPFVGMLLSIAIMPLIAGEWWEKKKQYMVILWSALFLIPLAIAFSPGVMAEVVCKIVFEDYLTFIVLLFGLFCVAGNISIKGNFRGTPKMNIVLLVIGTLLAGWIGTTGASMLMIRPILKANEWRHQVAHTVVFFIFMVANLGGCLTPVGDPPLLMGFMRGVPFFWSLRLMPLLLLNAGILLCIYFMIDLILFRREIAAGCTPATREKKIDLKIEGKHNVVFIAVIILAVVLSGTLPDYPAFAGGIHIVGEVELGYAAILEMVIILAAALLSMVTTKKTVRAGNCFSWGPIQEVAILFIGIFITMEPALLFLEANGASLGLTEPWQMFWVTGILSSFLDNTPTYLVFLTTAGTLGATSGIATQVGIIAPSILLAISAGAVCMGANTYIGNAPNFMVKSIAEDCGVKMPSFFGYMKWSFGILIPIFVFDMFIFFL